jgi:hypothetical protein
MNPEGQPTILQIAQIIQGEVRIKTGLQVREVVLLVLPVHLAQVTVDLQVRVDQVQVEGQALQEDSHESLKNLV